MDNNTQRQPIIPTFIDSMPPSPTRRQHSRMTTMTSVNNQNAPSTKLPMVASVSTAHQQLPCIVVEQSAEGAVSSMPVKWYQQPAVTMATASSVDNDDSSMQSSTERTISNMMSSQPTVYVQVMLQLGTQQQIPINIPAEVVVPALLSSLSGVANKTLNAPSRPVPTASPQLLQRTPSTHELKQAVMDHSSRHPNSPVVTSSLSKLPRLTTPVTTTTAGGIHQQPVKYTNLQMQSVSSPASSVSRQSSKREISSESDEDSKKSQQTNNRAAASRCRQKKKQQIEDMEKKAKKLQEANKQLEDEMRELKAEVGQFERLLTQHSDCMASTHYYVTTA